MSHITQTGSARTPCDALKAVFVKDALNRVKEMKNPLGSKSKPVDVLAKTTSVR